MRVQRVGRAGRPSRSSGPVGGGGAAVMSVDDAIASLSPASHWKFNAASGTFTNLGSNSLPLSMVGGSYRAVAGADGDSYARLNGYASTASGSLDNNIGAQGGTIFVIQKQMTFPTQTCAIVANDTPSNSSWALNIYNQAADQKGIRCWAAAGFSQNLRRTNFDEYTDADMLAWKALAVTFPGTTDSPELYINGAVAPAGAATSGNTPTSAAMRVWCGRWVTINNDQSIAHLAIFPTPLATGDLDTLWAAAAGEGWY